MAAIPPLPCSGHCADPGAPLHARAGCSADVGLLPADLQMRLDELVARVSSVLSSMHGELSKDITTVAQDSSVRLNVLKGLVEDNRVGLQEEMGRLGGELAAWRKGQEDLAKEFQSLSRKSAAEAAVAHGIGPRLARLEGAVLGPGMEDQLQLQASTEQLREELKAWMKELWASFATRLTGLERQLPQLEVELHGKLQPLRAEVANLHSISKQVADDCRQSHERLLVTNELQKKCQELAADATSTKSRLERLEGGQARQNEQAALAHSEGLLLGQRLQILEEQVKDTHHSLTDMEAVVSSAWTQSMALREQVDKLAADLGQSRLVTSERVAERRADQAFTRLDEVMRDLLQKSRHSSYPRCDGIAEVLEGLPQKLEELAEHLGAVDELAERVAAIEQARGIKEDVQISEKLVSFDNSACNAEGLDDSSAEVLEQEVMMASQISMQAGELQRLVEESDHLLRRDWHGNCSQVKKSLTGRCDFDSEIKRGLKSLQDLDQQLVAIQASRAVKNSSSYGGAMHDEGAKVVTEGLSFLTKLQAEDELSKRLDAAPESDVTLPQSLLQLRQQAEKLLQLKSMAKLMLKHARTLRSQGVQGKPADADGMDMATICSTLKSLQEEFRGCLSAALASLRENLEEMAVDQP